MSIAEWTDEAPHIITSAIDGETYDLTKNRIQWDLLPKDVQDAFRSWRHGFKVYHSPNWLNATENPSFYYELVYRARPAPKTTEHVLWWRAGAVAGSAQDCRDTHRLTIRHTGDTLPFGTYKLEGSDATFTVEKAE